MTKRTTKRTAKVAPKVVAVVDWTAAAQHAQLELDRGVNAEEIRVHVGRLTLGVRVTTGGRVHRDMRGLPTMAALSFSGAE